MILRKRTLAVILLFAILLCVQIEAAEAGLLLRLKSSVSGLFDPFLLLIAGVLLVTGVVLYVALFDKSLNLKENPGKDSV